MTAADHEPPGQGPTVPRSWSKAGERLYLRAVDSSIPLEMQIGDPTALRRARIILGFTLVLIVLGLEAAAFFTWAMPGEPGERVAYSLAAALGLTLLIPAAFRRFRSLDIGAFLLIAGAYLVITTVLTVTGGVKSELLHWMAVLPMLSALMGARRMAWAWGAIGLATMGLLVGLDAAGVLVSNHLDISSQPVLLWTQRVIDLASWVGILLVVALLYESYTGLQTKALAAKNRELLDQISHRERAEAETHYLAYYDDLTGLPNRRLYKEHLEQAIRRGQDRGWMIAVIFMDLDGFKSINDNYGHGIGDELLKIVSERLQSCIRGSDELSRESEDSRQMVSRLGGDEFTLLLVGLRSHLEAAIVARRIIKCLEEPLSLGDHEVVISASLGIALHARGPADVDELLRKADLAMYSAKDSGKRTFKFFEESMNEDITRRMTVSNELRRAIDQDEFVLHFQPIVEATNGRITGLEALVRWDHPQRGLLGPAAFIEIAEESSLIHELGEWVLTKACELYQEWRREGIAPDRVAVNVSCVQLRRGQLVTAVERALRTTGMDPRALELEITESAIMVDEDEATQCLEALHEKGIRIALDDFGTGYSSLSYVKRFPVDSLKIDLSFVSEIETDPGAQAISTAIIAMGHQLGLKVVAEGIESEAQLTFLRDRGCDELQGYFIGRPMGVKDIEERLAQQAED